jgi:signal transduction histidine kinase
LSSKIKNKIDIIKYYAEDNCTIIGNGGKLHQAFVNILSNSVQAIHQHGQITIKTKAKNDTLTISIQDNGVGIESQNIDKISDPFFTTKMPGKGTGLGLSITYSIVKEHQGHIIINSKIGEGTEFTVNLPIPRAYDQRR